MPRIPGIKAPEETCTDSKCPWHGQLSIRGRLREGTVVSTKMQKTAIIGWKHIRKLNKYERFSRRSSKIAAHVPECITVHEGDEVIIGECRKISKTKSFVILGKKQPKEGEKEDK